MSRLPGYRRLYKQDFEQQYAGLIDSLSPTINTGVEALYNVLNRNVDLVNNIRCTVKEVVLTVDANGFPITSSGFAVDVKDSKIIGCMVIRADNITNPATYPISQPFITFTQNANNVVINNVSGLQANNSYRLQIVGWN